MKIKYITKSPSQTKKLAEILAREILKNKKKKKAFVLGLEGDLGGGKTTFLQGFARGLRVRQKITSPTFAIMKKFRIPHSSFQNFFHLDCYRIKRSEELLVLDFKRIVSDPQNIIAIEWADRVKRSLLKRNLTLSFVFTDKNEREIEFDFQRNRYPLKDIFDGC